MKPLLALLFALAALPAALPEERKPPAEKPKPGFPPPPPTPPPSPGLERALRVLKFGMLNQYYEPSKDDAVHALGLIGDDRAVGPLCEYLANEDNEHLRFQIVRALAWIKSPKAVPALRKALKDDDQHVRRSAALALKEITGKDHEPEDKPARPRPGVDELMREADRLMGRAPAAGAFVEAGKSYRLALAAAPGQELRVKALEAPADGWLKAEVRRGEKTETTWVNLAAVALVTPDAGVK